ncbi:MAG TPA: phosphatidylglycerophosphatase A [Pseudomonadales bacterium]|nr:phosphatidylglycerophosphatase A [Pseudomonadales bacterium]
MFSRAINPQAFRNWRHWLAFGFGTGLATKAPGTWGTLAAVPFYCLFAYLPPLQYMVVLLVSSVLGVWLCETVSRDLRVHDHGGIVWDEIVGYWITMLMLPFSVYWMLAGFMLFRLLDIWKPWPICWCDKNVHGGMGIMLDDILAGILACLILHTVRLGAGL